MTYSLIKVNLVMSFKKASFLFVTVLAHNDLFTYLAYLLLVKTSPIKGQF